jgi:hypothetical protein
MQQRVDKCMVPIYMSKRGLGHNLFEKRVSPRKSEEISNADLLYSR